MKESKVSEGREAWKDFLDVGRKISEGPLQINRMRRLPDPAPCELVGLCASNSAIEYPREAMLRCIAKF